MLNARALAPYAVLFALGCLAYARLGDVAFLKDDLALSQITDAEGRPDLDALVRNFILPSRDAHTIMYRPLPVVLGYFDLVVFGVDPAGFRVCNILFHGLNGVLLALFFNQLTRFRRPAAGLFAGALFALHPLHGEAVVWITQRMVVLCMTFSLLALIGLEALLERRSRAGLATCIVASIAAALTKEIAIALPGVMVIQTLLHPAPAGRSRVRAAAVVAAAGAGLSAGILILRRVFFGAWVGTYAGLTPSQYAETHQTLARLPESLLNGLWAVNVHETTPAVRQALGIAWLAFLAVAVIRLPAALRDPAARRAAAVFAAVAITAYLPIRMIFFIEPSLTNGRFLYQPIAGLLGLLMLHVVAPARPRPLLDFGPPAAILALFAVVGQVNLRAFRGADAQVRTVLAGVAREARATPGNPVMIAYRVPHEYHGVPTLDLSLEFAVRPPFRAPPGLDVFPFVDGQQDAWGARVPALRAWLADPVRQGRPVVHVVVGANPDRVSPLIGTLAGASGRTPPRVLAPGDGAVIVPPAEEPTFVFEPVENAASYRLHCDAGGDAPLVFELDPAADLRRRGTQWSYRFPFPTQGVMPPCPVAWSLEALDAEGRSLGTSAARVMVLLSEPL